jgi:hypothetical protein
MQPPFALADKATRDCMRTLEDSLVLRSDEPPGADPHARWCGEGRLKAGPYPIGFRIHGLTVVLTSVGTAASTASVAFLSFSICSIKVLNSLGDV